MRFKTTIMATLLLVVFGGCASKKVTTSIVKVDNTELNEKLKTNNYNKFRYKPIIGTKQEDTKVQIDMGQFAKIWVKSYRNENKTFVQSHNIITMIREPGFIAGEDVPSSRRNSVKKTYSGSSFSFRSSDIQHNSNKSHKLQAKEIKDYVNNYNQAKKYEKLSDEKQKQLNKYDSEIKQYLEEKRKGE